MSKEIVNKDILTLDTEKCPDRFVFNQGEIVKDYGELVFYSERDEQKTRRWDFLINNGALLLVSPKLLNIIKRFTQPSDFQKLPCKIVCVDGVIEDYSVINLLVMKVGVDMQNSVCKYMTDHKTILGFKKLVFTDNALENSDIALLAEHTGLTMVSSKFAGECIINKIKGLRVALPDEIYY
jgi:hypothetical protein